ncbi:MAG: hypothetical protein GX335_09625 [Firmicutes bacterium]|nr:hypothetical protein [Bacillota bacterium]
MAILAVYSQATDLRLALFYQDLLISTQFSFHDPNCSRLAASILEWAAVNSQAGHHPALIVTAGSVFHAAPAGFYLLDDLFFKNLHLHKEADQAALIAARVLANRLEIPAYAIDPFIEGVLPQALVSGTPHLQRDLKGDYFVFKYLAKMESDRKKIDLQTSRFIIAVLNQELQIGAVVGGKVLDLCNSRDEGPFSWQQSGGLPFGPLLELSSSLGCRKKTQRLLSEQSGIRGYLGIKDPGQLFNSADSQTELIREAFAYQISKEIGAYGAALKGDLNGIVLAGELTQEQSLVTMLRKRIGFLGQLSVYPGNQAFPALLSAGKRIQAGAERIRSWEGA